MRKPVRRLSSFSNGCVSLRRWLQAFLERFFYSSEEGFGYFLIAFLREVHEIDELFVITIKLGLGVNQINVGIFFCELANHNRVKRIGLDLQVHNGKSRPIKFHYGVITL